MNKNHLLVSTEQSTQLALRHDILTWNDLLHFVQHLPYGRNKNREDVSLVLSELKGTCSSKHALLKQVATENQIPNVKLILGMYKMDSLNTPGIGSEMADHHLEYIPEAHCYLKINGKAIDVTSTNANIEELQPFIISELEIEPNQVSSFKVNYHKKFISNWMHENNLTMTLQEIWEIRENCIKRLSNQYI